MFTYKSTLITISFILVLFIVIHFILDFDGLYGQDSYEYLRYTKALHTYLISGKSPGSFSWPLYYPITGSIVSLLFAPPIALQLISIAALVISGYFISKTILLLYPRTNYISLYVLATFVFSPLVFRLGITNMSDMFCTALIVLSFYHGFSYYKKETIKHLYLVVVFSICAVMTRYVAFVVLSPLAVTICYSFFKTKKHFLHLPVLVLVGVVLLLPHVFIQKNAIGFLNHNALTLWSVINFFKLSFTTSEGVNNYNFPNIIYAFSSLFHPRFLFFGIVLVLLYFKTKIITTEIKIVLFSLLTYSLFLAGIPYQNNRFLLLSYPLGIIVLYPSYLYLVDKIQTYKMGKYLILILLFLQACFSYLSLKPILNRNILEKTIAKELHNYKKTTLYSFDIDVALQGRGLNFDYKNLWVIEYAAFEKDALVLFHPTKFQKQWKGQNPLLNWNKLNNEYNLICLKEFPDGWMLYKIKPLKNE